MKSQVLPKLLMLLGSVVITLIGLEIALMATGFSPAYEAGGRNRSLKETELLEPVSWWICDGEYPCHYDGDAFEEAAQSNPDQEYYRAEWVQRLHLINEQGFHDSDDFSASALPEDSYKVLALGDSFTFGFGAPIGGGWVEVLEKRLQAHSTAVVWNTGAVGTGTRQAQLCLENFYPVMEPDVVVLGFYPANDFEDNVYPVDSPAILKIGINARMHKLDSNLVPHKLDTVDAYRRTIGIVPPQYATSLEYMLYRTRVGTLANRGSYLAGYVLRKPIRTLTGWQGRYETQSALVTEQMLTEMRDTIEGRGGRFIVLIVPHPTDLDEPSYEYLKIREILDRLRIETVDPSAKLDLSDYVSIEDGHWNEKGHAKAAEEVLRQIAP